MAGSCGVRSPLRPVLRLIPPSPWL